MDLKGVTTLVRGAASGLGAATTQALLADGVTVVGIDLPSSIHQVPIQDGLDLCRCRRHHEDEVRAALDAVGGAELRLVVNCLGIGPSRRILSSRGRHDLAHFQRRPTSTL
ncbi:hypothetical protein AB4Y87_25340 [Paenarthrobacter sp. RAF54_2]|uniref:hypothetical protein n=1 Tax=Paenarthrobacter sp. RAF54_2 TaxID=3233061 RepID=UPI003F9B4CD6